MTLTLSTILFDTGCFVLTWLVQLVIYPSFEYYEYADLKRWHSKYTKRISLLVMPLMIGQLLTNTVAYFQWFSNLILVKLLLILTIWLVTFLVFVPMHKKITRITENKNSKVLVHKNWTRTVLWSLVFVISIIQNVILV
jgi:DMSO reductase anchor subunit